MLLSNDSLLKLTVEELLKEVDAAIDLEKKLASDG